MFGRFARQAFMNIPWGKNTPYPVKQNHRIGVIGMIICMGSEIVIILFRKNIAPKGLQSSSLNAASVFTILLSILSYLIFFNYENELPFLGNQTSYLITSISLLLLALTIIIKHINFLKQHKGSHELSGSTGDSYLFSFLKMDGWKPENIKAFIEPVLILSMGIAYSFYNMLGGAFIIYCALSCWGRLIIELLFFNKNIDNSSNSSDSHRDKKYAN